MSNNLRMVEQFASDFYHSKPSDLRGIVGDDFTFSSNLSQHLGFANELNFKQYLEYSNCYFNFLRAKQQFISTNDGLVFTLKFVLEILSSDDGNFTEITGVATITVDDSLIESVQTTYFADLSTYPELKKIRKKAEMVS